MIKSNRFGSKRTVTITLPDIKTLLLIVFFCCTIALGAIIATNSDSSGEISLKGERVLGNSDAPVTIVEFADFRCGYCARHSNTVSPEIKSQYVDTGKVKVVFKDLPVLGPDSRLAAVGGWCASYQDKFWAYHDNLFASSQTEGQAYRDFLVSVARSSGLDVSKFNSCLDSGKADSSISKNVAEATAFNITGTPGFIVMKSDGSSKQFIEGAQPFTEFSSAVDSLLN